LESASFPLARFVITEVSDISEAYAVGETVRFQMTGEMTIREISHELIFEVSIALNGDTLSGTATTSLYMADYGIDPPSFAGLLEVKDGVTIEIVFVAHKK
jgi:polyisoprenoid-binding protein YceI